MNFFLALFALFAAATARVSSDYLPTQSAVGSAYGGRSASASGFTYAARIVSYSSSATKYGFNSNYGVPASTTDDNRDNRFYGVGNAVSYGGAGFDSPSYGVAASVPVASAPAAKYDGMKFSGTRYGETASAPAVSYPHSSASTVVPAAAYSDPAVRYGIAGFGGRSYRVINPVISYSSTSSSFSAPAISYFAPVISYGGTRLYRPICCIAVSAPIVFSSSIPVVFYYAPVRYYSGVALTGPFASSPTAPTASYSYPAVNYHGTRTGLNTDVPVPATTPAIDTHDVAAAHTFSETEGYVYKNPNAS